jgi:hypothetical protein
LANLRSEVEQLDVVERRRLGTRAMRELLRAATSDGGLILWLDDVQWSDADSAALLGEVMRPPDAPPLLLLLTYRSEERDAIPLLSVLGDLGSQFPALALREIELRPLDPSNATELAGRLCGGMPLPPAQLDAIVAEAQGSPFLIHEMVRHLQDRRNRGADPNETVDLSNVVRDRLGELDPDEHRLLELISLCGQPTERGLLLRAAGLGSAGARLITRLENRSLVRVQVRGGEYGVQTYHDRIREPISGELPSERRVQHHENLAQVFEASGRVEPESARVAFSWRGAAREGRRLRPRWRGPRRRGRWAFTRAAELYRAAREWDPRGPERERMLRTREAECTANASRLVEAGRVYLAASRGAPRLEGLELRRRGSELLLAGGGVEEGTEALASLLDDLRLGLSPLRAARRLRLHARDRRRVAARLCASRCKERGSRGGDPHRHLFRDRQDAREHGLDAGHLLLVPGTRPSARVGRPLSRGAQSRGGREGRLAVRWAARSARTRDDEAGA